MLAVERKNRILSILQTEKKVVVSELSKLFSVSEETIRRDLEKLEHEGLVVKAYGGAVLNENAQGEDNGLFLQEFLGHGFEGRLHLLFLQKIDHFIMIAHESTLDPPEEEKAFFVGCHVFLLLPYLSTRTRGSTRP